MRYFGFFASVFLVFVFLFVGCAPESRYSGGSGSFKSYDDIDEYDMRDIKYKPKYDRSSSNNFNSPLVDGSSVNSVDNQAIDSKSSESSSEFYSNEPYIPPAKASSQAISSSPLVSGSGHFNATKSLLNGMRDSEALRRATMKPYTVRGVTYKPHPVKVGDKFDGIASWYGPKFHAKSTSNGETYNMYAHTAAHKTLPMNTIVRVYNKDNGKTTVVRINDRGPFATGRIIDLSNVAAHDIEMVGKGLANVRIEVVGFGGDLAHNKGEDSKSENSKKVMQDSSDSKDSKDSRDSRDSRDSKIGHSEESNVSNNNFAINNAPKDIAFSNNPSKNNLTSENISSNNLSNNNSSSENISNNNSSSVAKENTPKHTQIESKITESNEYFEEPSVLESNKDAMAKGDIDSKKPNKSQQEIIESRVPDEVQYDILDDIQDDIVIDDRATNTTAKLDSKSTESKMSEESLGSKDSKYLKYYRGNDPLSLESYKKLEDSKNTESRSQDFMSKNSLQDSPKDSSLEDKKHSDAKAVADGDFMISLNVFSSKSRAESFLSEILEESKENKHFENYKLDIVKTDKNLYRVALRGFKSQSEAKDFIAKNALKGHVVQE